MVRLPFELNTSGVSYMADTRVTLDSVIQSFLEGATAEEIAQKFPSLHLADIYSTIGYYLNNRAEIDEYLERSRGEAEAVRQANESRFPPEGVRARLLARKR